MSSPIPPASSRVTLKRAPDRGSYDPAAIRAFLDEQFLSHFAFVTPDGPQCMPTCFGRIDDTLYLHGAMASRVMVATRAQSLPICVTVTRLDGIVVAKSAFHHSMNFASVMIQGNAEAVTDFDEKVRALTAITDQVLPGRWDECRPATKAEINATGVLRLSLTEAAMKARTGGPIEAKGDLSGPQWSGVIPMSLSAGPPRAENDALPPASVDRFLARLLGVAETAD